MRKQQATSGSDDPSASASIMEDLARDESPITLSAARALPSLMRDGKRRSLPTIHRYALSGVSSASGERVRLEVMSICGVKMTTRSAVLRFIRRAGGSAANPSPRPRQAEIERAEHELAGAGIT